MKLLIATFIVCIAIGFVAGLIVGLSINGMDGVMDNAVATSGETGSSSDVYIVTAYCPCEKCCGKHADGHFANGQEISFPALAAPPEIPFGTKIHVPGYGVAEVKDRGSAITWRQLDVFFPDHQQALEWGVQKLKVEILK
jgi:3D (Asp-Asp-Asp) domain-containing protein